jgi:hypothetical protein
MERRDIWELRVTSVESLTEHHQLFSHRPTTSDVLDTTTVVPVRDMVKCFGIPRADGPLMCRMAGVHIGEIKLNRIPLFENGETPDDND